jgi:hypothetical protein
MKLEKLRAEWEAGVDTTNTAWLDTMWDSLPSAMKDFARSDPEAGLADLVSASNDFQLPPLRANSEHSQSKRPGRSEPLEIKPPLRTEEAERAAAFEEYLAYAANFDQDLHRFRDGVLSNRLLTAEQALAFVQSPAARFFRDHNFEFGGGNIPLTGHHATLDNYERGREGQKVWSRATVSVDPPGSTETVEKWTLEPLHKVIRKRDNDDVGDGEPLLFVNAEGRAQTSWVWDGSPLHTLRRLSEKLTKRYLWEDAQTTMFVLTGEIPARPPLRVSYEWKGAGVGSRALKVSQGVVTLEVAPWVSAKTVNRAYRIAQKRILRRDNRPIKEKNLKLFRFVTERLEPTGLFEYGKPQFPPSEEWMTEDELIKHGDFEKKPTGRELVREWDALPWVQKNQWTYGENTGRFWRDYKHTKLRIAYSAPPLQ